MEEIQEKRARYLERFQLLTGKDTKTNNINADIQELLFGQKSIETASRCNTDIMNGNHHCAKADWSTNGREYFANVNENDQTSIWHKLHVYQDLWQNLGQQLADLIKKDVQLTDQLWQLSNLVQQIKSIQRVSYDLDESPPLSPTVPSRTTNDNGLITTRVDSDDGEIDKIEFGSSSSINKSHTNKIKDNCRLYTSDCKAVSLVAVNECRNSDRNQNLNWRTDDENLAIRRQFFERRNSALRTPVKATRRHPRYKYVTVVGAIPLTASESTANRAVSLSPPPKKSSAGCGGLSTRTENQCGSAASDQVQRSQSSVERMHKKTNHIVHNAWCNKFLRIFDKPAPSTTISPENNAACYTMAPRLKRKSFSKSAFYDPNRRGCREKMGGCKEMDRRVGKQSFIQCSTSQRAHATDCRTDMEDESECATTIPDSSAKLRHSPSSSDSGVSAVSCGTNNEAIVRECAKSANNSSNHIISLIIDCSQSGQTNLDDSGTEDDVFV